MKPVFPLIVIPAAIAAAACWAWCDDKVPIGGPTNFRVNVAMVQLRATVTDGQGHYVRGLDARNFHVLENGVEQKIRFLTSPAQPAPAAARSSNSVFVLFDTSNAMYDGFVYAEESIAGFIRHLPASDAVAVYSFSRNVTRLARATRDRLRALIGLRRAVSGDDTALYDSILVTLRDAANVPGNKALVVFSNGPDTASMLRPPEVAAVAEDEGIPIYVVSTKRHNPRANAAFEDLSGRSGGVTYFAPNWTEESRAFDAIGQDLSNSYLIAYYPAPASSSEFRKIDVKVTDDAGHVYRVRTRAGYRPAFTPSE